MPASSCSDGLAARGFAAQSGAMRPALLLLMLLLLAGPAWAQYWTHYANARFGYEIDVPPGFEGGGESANGDGQMFYNLEGAQGVTVWGGYFSDSFEQEAAAALAAVSTENWAISAQSSTPYWATFAAQRDHRIIQQRMIALCDGASYAAFRAEYNIAELSRMEPVIDGLVRSFQPSNC